MNTPKIRKRALWGPFLVLLLAGLVLAGQVVHDSVLLVRRRSGAEQTWYRTGLDGSDSTDNAAGVDPQLIYGGDAYLRVHVRGSDGSGAATVCVQVNTAGPDGVFDSVAGVQTITLGLTNLGDGYLANAPAYFDVAGFESYDVLVTDVSTGTADIQANTCGGASVAAE